MRFRKDIVLGDISPVMKVAVSDRWFDDPEVNRVLGHGKGYAGQSRIRGEVKRALNSRSEEHVLWGIYTGSRPVGFAEILKDGKTAYLQFYYPKKYQGTNIPISGGEAVLRELFTGMDKVYRVEISILQINKRATRVLYKCGFRREGRRRHAFWLGNTAYNLVIFAMLRSEWSRLRTSLRNHNSFQAAQEAVKERRYA